MGILPVTERTTGWKPVPRKGHTQPAELPSQLKLGNGRPNPSGRLASPRNSTPARKPVQRHRPPDGLTGFSILLKLIRSLD
jgi:hypothetical protein